MSVCNAWPSAFLKQERAAETMKGLLAYFTMNEEGWRRRKLERPQRERLQPVTGTSHSSCLESSYTILYSLFCWYTAEQKLMSWHWQAAPLPGSTVLQSVISVSELRALVMGPAAAKTSRELQSLQPGWNPCPPFFHRPSLRSLIVLRVHLFALVFRIQTWVELTKKRF